MAEFGQTSAIGYSSAPFADDRIYANNLAYSPANDGTATSISLYCDQHTANTGNMCFALYDSNDGSFIAKTEEIAVTTTEGWHTATFTSPPNVYSSKNYYICSWFAPNFMSVWTRSDEEDGRYLNDTYDADYPISIPSWTSTSTGKVPIYCTYTPNAYMLTTDTSHVILDNPVVLTHALNKKLKSVTYPDGTNIQSDNGKSNDTLKCLGMILTNAFNSTASINAMMDNKETVTITGLPDSNHNTDYKIKSFNYKATDGITNRYNYDISLERLYDRL